MDTNNINNTGLLIPELIITEGVESFQQLMRLDYKKKGETDNYLKRLFHANRNGRIAFKKQSYYDIAKKMMLEQDLNIVLGWNNITNKMPSINITTPSDDMKSLGIGASEGYQTFTQRGRLFNSKSTTTDARYLMLISSDNADEVLVIYKLLRAMFVLLYEHFEFSGLRDLKISGQDIRFDQDNVPPSIIHRGLMLSFFYEEEFYDLDAPEGANELNFLGSFIEQTTTLE